MSRSRFGRARRRFRGWLSQYPSLYLPLVARRRRAFDGSLKAVARDTDVVIEGFPRSGNSFAFAAFRLSQEDDVRIAHHLHAPAQVVAASRMSIPTLVVIRSPEDAIISLLMRVPHLTPSEAYADYIRFYTRVYPYRRQFVLAKFEEVIKDFGLVMDRLNEKFETSFARFDHTDENVERCFDYVESISKTNGHRNVGLEMRVARPSAERNTQKRATRLRLGNEVLSSQREVAEEIYRRLVNGEENA